MPELNPLRADVDLTSVVAKLGHNLEEIRVRSLHNILSKLEHGVLSEIDLVQEQHLHIRLLEWFNWDKCPNKEEVLQLIKRLTKHNAAVQHYLEIGAVDFLSKLRGDIEESLHPVIDDILEHLLSLPDRDQPIYMQRCVYQHHAHNGPKQETLRQPESLQHSGIPAAHDETHKPTVQQGYFTRQASSPSSTTNSGYGCVKGLKFSTFPWLPLTPTDRHVLISTNSSLCSSRPSLVLTSCEFISDVVLRDFPAEIFLQRPNIVKSLLSLLALKPLPSGDNALPLAAMKCLRELSTLLLSRYKFYHDPALYCPKQDFGSQSTSTVSNSTGRASCSTGQSTLTSSSDPRQPLISRHEPRVRGDGRDGDSSNSVSPVIVDLAAPGSDTDSEDAIILQFSQLTLPQYSTDVLAHVTPLLKTSSIKLVVASIHLLHEILRLLEVAMTREIWDDGIAAGRALAEKLSDSFEFLGEALHYHYQQCHGDEEVQQSTVIVSHGDFAQHRLSAIAIVSLMKKLLQILVPVEKAKEILPESLCISLYLATMDEGLMYCIPEARPMLLNILERSLPSKFRLHQKALNICRSMECTYKFLHDKTANTKELLDLAETSLESLHYHRVLSLVDRVVTFCSNICGSADENRDVVKRSRKVLLKFLAHPEKDVQLRTYSGCLKIVKEAIDINKAVKPGSQGRNAECIHFLLNAEVLYEICCFGLGGSKEKVSSQASDLMLHLLQGKLLMGQATWAMFMEACIPVLPLMQTITDMKTQLSKCIVELLQPSVSRTDSENLVILPSLEKLRGSLRLLFCPSQSVRIEGAKGVLYSLAEESCSSHKIPSLDAYTLSDLADLFLMDHAISLESQDSGRSVFQVEGLLQVFNIFSSATSDGTLRKSALEQITIMLQDVTLHKAFLSQDGLEKILDLIRTATTASSDRGKEDLILMVPACLSILRHVLHENPAIRHQFAHEEFLYYLLIRGSLLCYTDPRARYLAAHVMVSLLFDEVASLSSDENQNSNVFSLPTCITKKYKLPFRCPTTKPHSCHRMESPPKPDPLTMSPVALRMLRIAWNIAWHGGVDKLMVKIESGALKECSNSFNPDLALTKEDKLLITCSHTVSSLKQCLQSVQEAASHYAVKVGLGRLSLWLLTDMMTQSSNASSSGNQSITDSLLQLDFKTVLIRFLEIFPASSDDKILLAEVLSFTSLLMSSLPPSPSPSRTDFLHWLGNVACSPKSTLVALLGKSKQDDKDVARRSDRKQNEDRTTGQRVLHKYLVAYFGQYVQCLPLSTEAWRRKTGYLGGSLTHGLLQSLNSADASHFYDLPSLENTLHSLVHVTARPGWSLDWSDGDSLSLCQLLLKSLLEVVSAFHVGRGGTAMSYMGKGVTKSATLCLCHLANEMATREHRKNWSSEWLYTRHDQEASSEVGLGWLIPLWSYRDPEVRAAGLGIAVVLSIIDSGCITMVQGCQHLTGGLWAVALGILTDQSECSIVRQQAALLLNNLLSHRLTEKRGDNENALLGLHVVDQKTKLTVFGLPALHVLLEHYNMYQAIAESLCYFYGQASIQPVSVVEDSTLMSSSAVSGLSTATTPDIASSQPNSQPNSRSTSPETVSHPTTMDALQPQLLTASAHSSDQSTALLLGKRLAEGTCSTSSSRSRTSGATSPNTSGRYYSVVTPCLVSGLCRLLQNVIALSPNECIVFIDKAAIPRSLIRLIDVNYISRLLHHLSLSANRERDKTLLQLSSHLVMCCDILRFLQSCMQTQNHGSRSGSLDVTSILMLGCKLLDLSSTEPAGSPTWKHIDRVRECVFSLMMAHVTAADNERLEEFMPVIVNNWTSITGAIIHILKSPVALSTKTVSLNFLARLLAQIQSHRRCKKLGRNMQEGFSASDDAEDTSQDIYEDMIGVLDERGKAGGCESTSGSLLCSILLEAYHGTLPRSQDGHGSAADDKTSVICGLRNLLAVSHEAKSTAVKAGLIESILDSIQHTHAKLNIECLQHPRPVAKKREEPLLIQLIHQIGLLQNCLCYSTEAKMSAQEAGLTQVVLKLWSWSVLDKRLLTATIYLLVAYTANCSLACSSLAHCPPGQSGSSLLHQIIHQIDREKGQACGQVRDDHQITRGLFAVLSNAVSSAECRNTLWKSGFLQMFSQVNPPKKRKSSNRRSSTTNQQLPALWLQLLANLTFAPEGQQMVMKIPDALDLLLAFGESSKDNVQHLASLVIHNLCFLGANKARLMASDKLLPFFERKLKSGSKRTQYMAVNALWALLYDSQKAKAIIKSSTVFQSLADIQSQNHCQHTMMTSSSTDTSLHRAVTSVMVLLVD